MGRISNKQTWWSKIFEFESCDRRKHIATGVMIAPRLKVEGWGKCVLELEVRMSGPNAATAMTKLMYNIGGMIWSWCFASWPVLAISLIQGQNSTEAPSFTVTLFLGFPRTGHYSWQGRRLLISLLVRRSYFRVRASWQRAIMGEKAELWRTIPFHSFGYYLFVINVNGSLQSLLRHSP